MLEKYGIKSVSEMAAYSKESWNQKFSGPSEMFVDAYQNGEFHEHEPDWKGLAAKLTPAEIANLYPPIAKFLIASGIRENEEKELALIMRLNDALVEWSVGHLKHPNEILEPLRLFSNLLENHTKADEQWKGAIVAYFEILRHGILNRMGCWAMSDAL